MGMRWRWVVGRVGEAIQGAGESGSVRAKSATVGGPLDGIIRVSGATRAVGCFLGLVVYGARTGDGNPRQPTNPWWPRHVSA
jgi:hypothetical protein